MSTKWPSVIRKDFIKPELTPLSDHSLAEHLEGIEMYSQAAVHKIRTAEQLLQMVWSGYATLEVPLPSCIWTWWSLDSFIHANNLGTEI